MHKAYTTQLKNIWFHLSVRWISSLEGRYAKINSFVNIKMFVVWTHDKEKRKKAISYNILSTYCNRMSVTCKKKVAKIQHTAPAWQICTDIYQFEIFCQTCFFSLGTTAFRTTCEICNLKREGWPLNPQGWLTFNLPLHQTLRPQELRIRSKLKKLLIVEWILLVSILGNLKRTVWRTQILMRGCRAFITKNYKIYVIFLIPFWTNHLKSKWHYDEFMVILCIKWLHEKPTILWFDETRLSCHSHLTTPQLVCHNYLIIRLPSLRRCMCSLDF